VGIKIFKPEIYLGSTKLRADKISRMSLKTIQDKIGSNYLHVEHKKDILEMSLLVSKKTLNKEKIKPDFLIFVSQGQDDIFPSAAESLASKLGLGKNILVLTLSSGCSGFVQALIVANKLLNNKNKNGLIVCAEKYSKYISKNDIKTRILFSDAASATIVKHNNKNNFYRENYGHDGKNASSLMVKNINGSNRLKMNGQNVFLFGINNIPESIKRISKNLTIDKYLMHNASKIMIDAIVKKSSIDPKKICTSFHLTGNTVSSSIPLLINLNYRKLLNKKILMSGFGVGLSWASIVMKFI
jgi:3-oxoacyl-[acyl-carrier-protein] synthase-3